MASGKSTVGRLLARQLGSSSSIWMIIIEANQKKSIKDIFSEKGEIFLENWNIKC
ncbi:shikimate kinase [Flagellimonas oceanensis]|uniref:shikimate kinase n=1 Tax=Flagellimonas oceanensis TaxID=2499163 RepID=UPI003BAB37FE